MHGIDRPEYVFDAAPIMADYLRAVDLCQRVLAEVPAIGNSQLASEIRELQGVGGQ